MCFFTPQQEFLKLVPRFEILSSPSRALLSEIILLCFKAGISSISASSLAEEVCFQIEQKTAKVRKQGGGYRNQRTLFTLHQEFQTLVPRVEILSSSAGKEELRTLIAKEF